MTPSVSKKGLPAQNILEHLEKENLQGQTILHLAELEDFADLLCHLSTQQIDVNHFQHWLSKKSNYGKSFKDKIANASHYSETGS